MAFGAKEFSSALTAAGLPQLPLLRRHPEHPTRNDLACASRPQRFVVGSIAGYCPRYARHYPENVSEGGAGGNAGLERSALPL